MGLNDAAIVAHHHEIEEKAKEVDNLRGEYQDAKDAALAAKKTFDTASGELLALIRRGPNKQAPLFDSQGNATPQASADTAIERKPAHVSPAAPAASKLVPEWHSHPIHSVSTITAKMREKLIAAGIKTVGELLAMEDADRPKGISAKQLGTLMGLATEYGIVSEAADSDDGEDEEELEEDSEVEASDDQDSEGDGIRLFQGPQLSGTGADWDPDNEPTFEPDPEYAEESQAEAEPLISDGDFGKFRITENIEGMEHQGAVVGAEVDGYMNGDSAVVTLPSGTELLLNPGEFECVGPAETQPA